MTSLRKVLGRHVALGGVLLAAACQVDSSASFDNTHLDGSGASGGSQAAAGDGNVAASSMGGSSATAGKGGSASKAGESNNAGGPNGGVSAGGSAGKGSSGDAGSGPEAGAAQGGMAGKGGIGGMGGVGGKPVVVPDPVTLTITEIEDAYVDSCHPFSNYGDAAIITLDNDDSGCVFQSLLRGVLDELPDAAIVSEAKLNLTCTDVGGVLTVSYANEAWLEDNVHWNARPEVGTALGTMECTVQGPMTFDLTAALKAWLAGDTKNYGIYLRTETDAGTDFASSESEEKASRPSLTVTYTLPIK